MPQSCHIGLLAPTSPHASSRDADGKRRRNNGWPFAVQEHHVPDVRADRDGLVAAGSGRRAAPSTEGVGGPPGDGRVLPWTLWLADAAALGGRFAQASELFESVLRVGGDGGLLAEEYDPAGRRLL